MIELEVNIQKHSVKVKVSDLNFSCLQKLKAKKKKISAWFICRNLFGDIGVSKTYQQEQVFNYEVFNK